MNEEYENCSTKMYKNGILSELRHNQTAFGCDNIYRAFNAEISHEI